jgi:hypothetical protein
MVVGGAFTAIRRTRHQRQREFEDFYVRRYWELLDRLSIATLRGIDLGRRLSEDEKRTIRLYFRLSEDEADLREQGWVSNATWNEWRGAIRSQLGRQPYERLWQEAVKDAKEQRDYSFRHLRFLCGPDGESYDPLAPKWYRRWPWSRRWPSTDRDSRS